MIERGKKMWCAMRGHDGEPWAVVRLALVNRLDDFGRAYVTWDGGALWITKDHLYSSKEDAERYVAFCAVAYGT